MANLKEVRNRITSVSSTQQITSAMKMVSASKLRRAQDAIVAIRPYADKLKEILANLCSISDSSQGDYSADREVKTVLLIAITSNRGLCGAFNSNVIKLAKKKAEEKFKGKTVSVLSIGKKSEDYFKKTELHIVGSDMPKRLSNLYDDLTYDNVAVVAEKLMENYIAGQFDHDLYHKYLNKLTSAVGKHKLGVHIPSNVKNEMSKYHGYGLMALGMDTTLMIEAHQEAIDNA